MPELNAALAAWRRKTTQQRQKQQETGNTERELNHSTQVRRHARTGPQKNAALLKQQ